ncbi:class I SAM-dependent methyltransferase [Hahella sp. HN01]|nr:class I SAM-dependent methyltransferase [Hahella sp. HN01]
MDAIMDKAVHACRICMGGVNYVGATDFNKSGSDHFEGRRVFPPSLIQVDYYRCRECGFMFTPYFDDWSDADFERQVYNSDYLKADPPFAGERAARLSQFLTRALGDDLRNESLLDFGGGEGHLERLLRRQGFSDCATYDPHHHANCKKPSRIYNLVTTFEVVEHVSDQHNLFKELCSLVAPNGALLLSTLLQPRDIEMQGVDWWYACPRNAHMAFHTRRSLQRVLQTHGFYLESLSDELHIAFRRPNVISDKFLSLGAASVQVNDSVCAG